MGSGLPPSLPRDTVPVRKADRIAPVRLTLELTEEICKLVRARVPPTVAASSLVSERVYFKWMQLGREGKRADCVRFMQAVEKARAEAEIGSVVQVVTAAKDPRHWTAAAWMLERSWPERWARVERTEHTGEGGGPIQHNVLVIGGTSEEWVKACQEADRLARANGQTQPVLEVEAVVADE